MSAPEATKSEAMVRAAGVSKSFGRLQVLKDVDFEVPRGTVCIVIGPSGSGKSTLLRCINFLERYDEGAIWVDGAQVGYVERNGQRKLRPRREIARMRSDIGMVFQQFNLFSHLTAFENVSVPPVKVKRVARAVAREQAEALLVKVGLRDRMHAYPGYLSGGEQQRVAIARALAMQPKVLLFDEITSALDPERVAEVLEVIRQLASEGMTMVVVTHEMAFARDIADQVIFMDQARIVARGSAALLDNPESDRLKSFLGKMTS